MSSGTLGTGHSEVCKYLGIEQSDGNSHISDYAYSLQAESRAKKQTWREDKTMRSEVVTKA